MVRRQRRWFWRQQKQLQVNFSISSCTKFEEEKTIISWNTLKYSLYRFTIDRAQKWTQESYCLYLHKKKNYILFLCSSGNSCRWELGGICCCKGGSSKTSGVFHKRLYYSLPPLFRQDLQALQSAINEQEIETARKKVSKESQTRSKVSRECQEQEISKRKVPKECQTTRPKFSCTTNTRFFTSLSQKPR